MAFIGISPDTEEITYPKDFDHSRFFNCDRIGRGTLHVVSHPLDVLRQIDTGIPDLTNTVAVLTAITPAVLDALAAFAREREVDAIEFHV